MPLITAIQRPNVGELQRILQMSLVLSTQAKYSSFFQVRGTDSDRRDEEVRQNVDSLGKITRWHITQEEANSRQNNLDHRSSGTGNGIADIDALARNTARLSLNRAPSIRQRRRGWRASSLFGQQWGPPLQATTGQGPGAGGGGGPAGGPERQNSEYLTVPEWGRPVDDEEDDDVTPNQSLAPRPEFAGTLASTLANSQATAFTMGTTATARDGGYEYGYTPRTPMPG